MIDDATTASTLELCRLLSCTKGHLSHLERDGVISRTAHNSWPLMRTVRAVLEHMKKQRNELSAARTEWERAKLRREELRLQREAGDLCRTADFNTAITMITGKIVAGLVALPAQHHPHDLQQRHALERRIGSLRNDVADWCETQASELKETARKSARRRA
jgi:phage host-nuclease inhibitor protein Gam